MSGIAESKGESSEILVAGTRQCPYKLAVIGGGPSGCSVIIRAFRIGFGGELCGFCTRKPAVDRNGKIVVAEAQYPFQSAGVCLIDEGPAAKFGGGKLQDYIINANTWANKFVTNVMDDKDVLPKETVVGTPLQGLGAAPTAVSLKSFGCKPAPLQMVGAFLRDAGSIVRDTLNEKYSESSQCMLETSVTSMQQVMLPVPDKYLSEDADKNNPAGSCIGWKLCLSQRCSSAPNGKLYREIYAHKVVMATGGRQELPKLPNPAHTKKLMSSDYICTQKGIDDLRSRLVKAGIGANKITPGRVVIIGGSHSAFSAAWLCLNRINGETAATGAAATNSENKAAPVVSAVPADEVLQFGQSGICLVHKSSIKVFYCTKGDADRDGYIIEGAPPSVSASNNGANSGTASTLGSAIKNNPANGGSSVSKAWLRGQIHPFGGLRGDAKELWRAAKDGRETRLKLVQVRQNVATLSAHASGPTTLKQQSIVEKLFDEAVVIVWACGYSTNLSMPVLDVSGTPVQMRIKCGQVEVDDNARVISAHPSIGVQPGPALAVSVVAPVAALAKPKTPSPVNEPISLDIETVVEPTVLSLAEPCALLGTEEDSLGTTPSSVAAKSHSESKLTSPSLSPTNKSRISPSLTEAPIPASEPTTAPGTPVVTSKSVDASQLAPRTVQTPCPSPSTSLVPPLQVLSPPYALRSSSTIVKPAAPPPPVIEGLLGSGLGFGLQALLESGLPDGSSGRADGVAVYLKRGATLVLAQVLGNRVFGGPNVNSWEDRLKLLKKIAAIASAQAAKNAENAAVASSVDTGISLLGSPSSKRPSTTAGTRNSFSFGSASPTVKDNSAGRSGGNSSVLKRAIASKENGNTAKSAQGNFSPASSLKKNNAEIPFPLVKYAPEAIAATPDRSKNEIAFSPAASPSRPMTTSGSGRSLLTLEVTSPSRSASQAMLSPKSAIEAAASSPEAMRCMELVDKVAMLSADLELQMKSAKEYLAIPAEGSAEKLTESAAVSKANSNKPESTVLSTPTQIAVALVQRPPRSLGPSPAATTASGTTSGGSSNSASRVLLTPISVEAGGKVAEKVLFAGSKPSPRASIPRDGSSKPRNGPPLAPQASSSSSTPREKNVVLAAGTPISVLRSNSLNNKSIALIKVSAPSPRSAATSTNNSARSGSNNNIPTGSGGARPKAAAGAVVVVSPTRNGVPVNPIQGKNVKLELPSIPMNKRSQNQKEETPVRRASIAKDNGIAMSASAGMAGSHISSK
eukprot:CAMPEP_0184983198 /NCGR_PEP_ID=MMETSP1098-20130426/12506_1 /TAXON_ID=89044 /ORGANISM="Spumella elongata, Strain CCAP 955/1" /LENGTH=1252 /DNA_ID=CAMNT_0027507003 /DNA_START=65 /DNA_END=3823 /DNA_ORIENTATION=-